MFKRLRHMLAYLIAPDYFNDIEHRFSYMLYHATGGMLSKTNYSFKTMLSAINDYRERCCDKCEYKKAAKQDKRILPEQAQAAIMRHFTKVD